MPFSIAEFCNLRPMLYHLTARENLSRIQQVERLHPAIELLRFADQRHQERTRRHDHLRVIVEGSPVMIRDQRPLYEGNVALEGGWRFEDLVLELNSRVFFWPGTSLAPISAGLRHFHRYRHEDCVIISVATRELFELNIHVEPQFCRFNSGSPRCNPKSGKSSRGPDTFLPADRFDGTAGKVVETVFRASISLPMASARFVPLTELL